MSRFPLLFFRWSLGLLVGTAAMRAAVAPDSLAGRVYHEMLVPIGQSVLYWRSVYLRADGTASYHWAGSQNLQFFPGGGYAPVVAPPPADTTWTYVRSGETTGTLILGGIAVLMTFSSPAKGTVNGGDRFALTDPETVRQGPLANVSLRARAEPGRAVIAGFVVPGDSSNPGITPQPEEREVLIRAVGPSLAPLGVTGVWSDPEFKVMRGSVAASAWGVKAMDWSVDPNTKAPSPVFAAAFTRLFTLTGAFQLLPDSKDAVAILHLPPGAYTVVCEPSVGSIGGEVLIEVYLVP